MIRELTIDEWREHKFPTPPFRILVKSKNELESLAVNLSEYYNNIYTCRRIERWDFDGPAFYRFIFNDKGSGFRNDWVIILPGIIEDD